MHKFILILVIFAIALPLNIQAQEFCGTAPYKSKELIDFQTRDESWVDHRSGDMLYLEIIVHLVGETNGTGHVSKDIVYDRICETNEIYADLNVQFYISGFRYLNNSSYFRHNNMSGSRMMSNNNVSGVINMYFVDDPAGACGYYSPAEDAVAIGNKCIAPGSITVPHELGHYLSLPHTFYGWEGTTYDPNNSTPKRVNNRETELVDRSNCTRAGDGFCDTPPDYLSDRWACGIDSMSTFVLKDHNDEKFKVDGSNIMGYSLSGCGARFSQEQSDAMRYNILSTRHANVEKPNLVEISEDWIVSGNSPEMDAEVFYGDVTFSWDPIEGAEGYILEYTFLDKFNTRATKVYVTEPTHQTFDMSPNWKNIQWRVKPYGLFSVCIDDFGDTFKFTLKKTTATSTPLNNGDIKVYPNPANSKNSVTISSEKGFTGNLKALVYNSTGELIIEDSFENYNNSKINLNIQQLSTGLHFIKLITPDGYSTHKLMVND